MQKLSDPGMAQALRDRVYKLHSALPPLWGKMTAPQMVCHLSDAFRSALGGKQVSSVATLFQRTIVKWVALYMPMQWPRGVPTRPEVEQGVGGTPPVEWERDRAELIALMNQFLGSKTFTPHPMFGDMTQAQRMRWAYLHMDHHLRQFGV
jgi:hypothetical protein